MRSTPYLRSFRRSAATIAHRPAALCVVFAKLASREAPHMVRTELEHRSGAYLHAAQGQQAAPHDRPSPPAHESMPMARRLSSTRLFPKS